ncbi:MAG: TRAP transporter small permease subunit [Gammaproteobacteria bacterium]|nr:TRAP transporter small permease subunit [Gammaproteobacteria bacterium]
MINRIIQTIDYCSDRLGKAGSWLALLMVSVMFLIVLLRYAFQIGSIALQESVMYINALIFTVGVGYTLKEQGHVRVDVFYNKLNAKQQALVDMLGCAVFMMLTAGFILGASWDYVAVSWRILEGSAESSGLPLVYLLKTTILLIASFLGIQGVAEFLKSMKKYRQE